MNVPSRVRIGIYQRQTMLCVATALSSAAGLWRIDGLNPTQHFTVIGFDNRGDVNAAIQDWVKPEPYEPESLRKMYLVGLVEGSSVGQSVSWKVRAAYAQGTATFTVSNGSLPPGWDITSVETTCLISGASTAVGAYTFELTAQDEEGNPASATYTVEVLQGYKFWRIVVTDNNGHGNYTTLVEVQLRAAAGGINQAVGGTATASSQANSDNVAAYAFDGNAGSKWTSAARPSAGAPQWVQYEFLAAAVVRQFAVTGCIGGQESMAPRDFVIERSADGLVWEPALTVTGQTGWTGGQVRLFDLP